MIEKAMKVAKEMHYEECEDCAFHPTRLGCRWRKEGTYCDTTQHNNANFIESLAEIDSRLEYTLVGVMHFVDKWLNGIEPYSIIDDNDGQIAVERAAEARRITLEYIEGLQKQLDQVTQERDAAVRDLERAEESADEVCRFLDNEVHPVCDYRLYIDLHNAVSEIVRWKNDEQWRGMEKEVEG